MNIDLISRVENFKNLISKIEITQFNISSSTNLEFGISAIYNKLLEVRDSNNNIYIVGNGGSASVAAHAVTDFFNVAKLKATTMHESSLLTCMANDFGYENAVARMLKQCLNSGDMLISISSSGNSLNMLNAAEIAREKKAFILTLTGFNATNPLRQLGDINVWIPSSDYGFVEIGHQFVLHNIADRFNTSLLGKACD